MKLSKIQPDQLKVGMKVAVATPFRYGWGRYTGLTNYNIHTISRITPKKTKVICGEYEYPAKDTTFYLPSDEIMLENRRIKAFTDYLKCVSDLNNISPLKFIGTADEMERTVNLLKEVIASAKDVCGEGGKSHGN